MKTPQLLKINYKYITSAKTNVLDTFRRLGFMPPSEDKQYQEKWKRFRNSNSINEGFKK
jgi:hypothetical protein